MKRTLIPVALVGLVVGCASAPKFVPYAGDQIEWKTGSGSLVETVNGMPVHHGVPHRPWDLLGTLEMDGTADVGTLKRAVAECRKHGGTALILHQVDSEITGTQTFGRGRVSRNGQFNLNSFTIQHRHNTAVFVVIRYRE
jgi:hypothetical protein